MTQFWKSALILFAVAAIGFGGGAYWRNAQLKKHSLHPPIKEFSGSPKNDYLKIFRYDPVTDDEVFGVYVTLPSGLPIKDKLSLFANRLSEYQFRGLPIELLSIDSSDGRRIATINLKEIDTATAPSWKRIYFQGSSGGGHTTRVLVNSFLQEDYPGEWVDGVEFYYENRPLLEFQFDHIILEGIKLRGQNSQ